MGLLLLIPLALVALATLGGLAYLLAVWLSGDRGDEDHRRE